MAYEALQVPGEPGVWMCARHHATPTRLRCGRCEKPICPKCTVMGPVGARCRECASNRSSHMYQVGPLQFALAFGAGAVMGGLGSVLIDALGFFALWGLLYAPAVGPLLGGVVSKLTRGKRGPVLAGVSGAGIAVGALGTGLFTGAIFDPIVWLMAAIAIVGVWLFLR